MEDKSSLVPSFTQGMNILLVDNDKASLMYLSSMLEQYAYKVTTAELATSALWMVEEQKERFKLVMANVKMPDMDTLQFLHFLLDKDIPVIFVSSESNISAAKKSIAEGASFYLSGQIFMDDLKYIWQHAYRKKTTKANHKSNNGNKFQETIAARNDTTQSYKADFRMMQMDNMHIIEKNICRKMSEIGQLRTVNNIQKENVSKTKKRSNEDQQGNLIRKVKKVKIMHEQVKRTHGQDKNGNNNSNGNSCERKSRIVWTPELHLKFTAAISELGDKKARPKPILEIMNVPNLSARQVASHLQKYRSQVQRICESGITNLPAVSRSSNFYGWTRNFETLEPKTSESPTSLQPYQPTQTSDFGNLLEILKQASSNNYTSIENYQKFNAKDVSNRTWVMGNSNNNSNGDYCLDEWVKEILNPDRDVEMPDNSGDTYEQVLNDLEGGLAADEPNPNDVDRYCNWLTDAFL